jgi:hypothetical protein
VASEFVAAFAGHDRSRMLALADPRISVVAGHLAERTGRRDPYHGHDGLGELLDDVTKAWTELEVTPQEYLHAGRAVLVTGTLSARSEGAMLTGSVAWIYRMRRRKVVSIEIFRCRDDALAAIEEGRLVSPAEG